MKKALPIFFALSSALSLQAQERFQDKIFTPYGWQVEEPSNNSNKRWNYFDGLEVTDELLEEDTIPKSCFAEEDVLYPDFESRNAWFQANFPKGFDWTNSRHMYFKKAWQSEKGILKDNCYTFDGNDMGMKYIFDNKIEGSEDMIVAFIDTGIDFEYKHHQQERSNLEGRQWINTDEIPYNGIDDDNNGYIDDVNGWNFFYNSGADNMLGGEDNGFKTHGTYLAHMFGANGDETVWGEPLGLGIDTKAKIMNLVVFGKEGDAQWAVGIEEAIRYAVDNGAKVINLSLGQNGTSIPQSKDDLQMGGITEYDEAIAYAWSKGAVLVNCSGNVYEDNSMLLKNEYSSFGSQPELLTVGGIETGTMGFSDMMIMGGKKQDVVTFNHLLPFPDGQYTRGSSNATAVVSGVVSLFWANNPHLKNWEVKKAIVESVRDQVFTPESDGWLIHSFMKEYEEGFRPPYNWGVLHMVKDIEGWDEFYGYGAINMEDLFSGVRYREIEVNPENGATGDYVRPTEVSMEHIEKYNPSLYQLLTITSTDDKYLSPKVVVYPNPCYDYIKLQNYEGEYTIYNILGQETKRGTIKPNEQINVRDQSKIFFIKLESIVLKVIKMQ